MFASYKDHFRCSRLTKRGRAILKKQNDIELVEFKKKKEKKKLNKQKK